MSFHSQHAPKIWNRLYTVSVPDQLTQSPEYLRRFGTHVTGNKEVDAMLSKNLTQVMIPVSKILEYFEAGFEVHIHQREDMIQIHKDIELYLSEWREHLKYDINLQVSEHKVLILALEKLSKELYNKAKPAEVIDNLFEKKQFGLVNPMDVIMEAKRQHVKPNYEGIGQLVRSKTNKPVGRF